MKALTRDRQRSMRGADGRPTEYRCAAFSRCENRTAGFAAITICEVTTR